MDRARPKEDVVRDQLREEDERAVLRATADLVQERGYADLTIAAIAERAGTTKPAIYRRWPSKAHLVHEAVFPISEATELPDTGSLAGAVNNMGEQSAPVGGQVTPGEGHSPARREPAVNGVRITGERPRHRIPFLCVWDGACAERVDARIRWRYESRCGELRPPKIADVGVFDGYAYLAAWAARRARTTACTSSTSTIPPTPRRSGSSCRRRAALPARVCRRCTSTPRHSMATSS